MPDKVPANKIRRAEKKALKKSRIKDTATNYKSNSDLETRRFTVGYEFYKQNLCQVDVMNQSPLRKSIQYFKQVCMCTNVGAVNNLGADVKPVGNKDTYKRYYNGLKGEDIEVKELRAGDSARHFFFIDPANKIVQMIAHVNTHTPLNKQR